MPKLAEILETTGYSIRKRAANPHQLDCLQNKRVLRHVIFGTGPAKQTRRTAVLCRVVDWYFFQGLPAETIAERLRGGELDLYSEITAGAIEQHTHRIRRRALEACQLCGIEAPAETEQDKPPAFDQHQWEHKFRPAGERVYDVHEVMGAHVVSHDDVDRALDGDTEASDEIAEYDRLSQRFLAYLGAPMRPRGATAPAVPMDYVRCITGECLIPNFTDCRTAAEERLRQPKISRTKKKIEKSFKKRDRMVCSYRLTRKPARHGWKVIPFAALNKLEDFALTPGASEQM